MKKFQKLYQLKQLVKLQSEYAKYNRLTRKAEYPQEFDVKLSELKTKVQESGFQRVYCRHSHIAYSLLKGKTYPQIENSVKVGNDLEAWEWEKIADLMTQYKDEENTVEIPVYPFPTTKINYPKDSSLFPDGEILPMIKLNIPNQMEVTNG